MRCLEGARDLSVQLFEEEAPRANTVKNGRGEKAPQVETLPVEAPVEAPKPAPAPSAPPVVEVVEPVAAAAPTTGPRTLGDDNASLTHRFKAGSVEGIFIVGLFDDGTPGEALFVPRTASPAATTALNAVTEALNLALPYGVPAGPLAARLATLASGDAQAAVEHLAAYLNEKFSSG